MRKFIILVFASILLIANTTFGEPNLIGTWEYTQDCVRAGDPWDETPHYITETVEFVIQEQDAQGRLFGCAVTGSNPPYTFLYGIIDGKEIYITAWDSITVGKVKKMATRSNLLVRISKIIHHLPPEPVRE